MNTFTCGSELRVSFRSKSHFAGGRICVARLCGHTSPSAVSAGLSREVSAMLFSRGISASLLVGLRATYQIPEVGMLQELCWRRAER